MKKTAADILKYLLSVALAVVLLYFSFRGIDWSEFSTCLASCRWGYVLLSMAAGAAVFYIRALRWRMLLLPIDGATSRLTVFNAVNISYLANMVLPRIGEFVRCGVITRGASTDSQGRRTASYDKVLGTVVVERIWDMLVVMVLTLSMLLMMRERIAAFLKDSIFAGLTGSTGLPVMLAGGVLLVTLLILSARHFQSRSHIAARIYGVLRGIWSGVRSCLEMPQAWRFILYTALIWLMYWLMSASIIWAVQGIPAYAVSADSASGLAALQSLDMGDALFLMIVGAVSTIIPAPGGFGTFHAFVSAALTTVYGIPFSLGRIFATLSHESQAVTQALFGLLSYASEALRRRR